MLRVAIAEVDRDADEIREKVAGVKQKLAPVYALLEELRDSIKRTCLDFSDADDDIGHVSDSLDNLTARLRHCEIAVARDVGLLEMLIGPPR